MYRKRDKGDKKEWERETKAYKNYADLQYHQGPEWVFPTGWFLMAYLKFDLIAGEGKQASLLFHFGQDKANKQDKNKTLQYISEILLKHAQHVSQDNWRGLPELTNSSESPIPNEPPDPFLGYEPCNTRTS